MLEAYDIKNLQYAKTIYNQKLQYENRAKVCERITRLHKNIVPRRFSVESYMEKVFILLDNQFPLKLIL